MKRTVQRILLLLLLLIPVHTFAESDYILDTDGRTRIPVPLTYEVTQVIKDLGSAGYLNKAEDLFIDNNGLLYVADTGNNRVIKMTREGAVQGIYKGPQEKPMTGPKGIYVDRDGDMYIADTGNSRILHLSSDGEYIEQFVKPESELLDPYFTFAPNKIYINSTGYIYALKSMAFITMDAENNFRGYVGAAEVGFNLRRMLIRMFSTPEQKKRMVRAEPPPYSNFVIDDAGMVYAVLVNSPKDQIRKLNSIGKNIYKEGFYGEMAYDERGRPVLPYFTDIAVDKAGIVSVLEQKSGKIYQYDQEGNLLTVFGGSGNKKGVFKVPVSIVADGSGKLYVLDSSVNSIQVFTPTRFITTIHQAVNLYSEGHYDEAVRLWQDVLKTDENYQLAHTGIGKALMKKEKWEEALGEYIEADDRDGYSLAYAEYLHTVFREHFLWIVVLLLVSAAVLIWVLARLKAIAGDDARRLAGKGEVMGK